jgi:hypothetical protein
MSTRLRICLLCVVLVLGLGFQVGPSQATHDGAHSLSSPTSSYPADYPWASQYIQQELDPPRDVGGYVSLALLPFNNFLLASYYDATDHSLIMATPVPNHSGNCGTNHNWFCVTFDGGVTDVGRYASSDFWGYSADNWKWGISYYDATNRLLKVAIRSCYYGTCTWTIAPVALPDTVDDSVGMYSSFKFDSTGNAAVATTYFDATYTERTLLYANQVPSGGNCGAGDWLGYWECDDIFYVGGAVQFPSLDFSFNDTAYIAYYDANYGSLRLAIEGQMCMPEIGWSCEFLDGGVADVGYYPAMIAPQFAGDIYRIAYYDKTNGYLKYFQEYWDDLMVDDVGAGSIVPMGISMILDQDGSPVIAYRKVTSEFAPPQLGLARPAYEYGLDYGNCGDTPPGFLFTYWQCITLDHAGQYWEEASFVSMVMNSSGLLGIAYTEYDSGYDVTSLKFTYQTYLKTYLPTISK